ncbi:hypothetical protein RFI_21069 [Reticulomyxa filosa]|uniref:Uncharacterized protein n=1 Tax=Reticulomyxa filosa TaxID=46433 RepID=X6MS47_RETFI|nr:hypothetical protein RFI_21069 [Reticulomyxa filosa]|eukprot:ETO16287.1 hypothetical protein RFI_21069 [Reticulomyxa filosa]
MDCCQPDIPHEHSKKFLLLGSSDHKQQVLADESTKTQKKQLQVLLYSVAKFFTRPWYIPLFPGGVWWIDLSKLQSDPDGLLEFMADCMEIDSGKFQSRDSQTKEMVDYPQNIHQQICQEQHSDTPKVIVYVDDKDQSRFILFREHKNHHLTLKAKLPLEIFKQAQTWFKIMPNDFPKEVWQDSETGKAILSQIREKCQGVTLFIFDHLTFSQEQLQRFWNVMDRLLTELRSVRILLLCRVNICKEIESFDFKCPLKCRVHRLVPISGMNACSLLRQKFCCCCYVYYVFIPIKNNNDNNLEQEN